MTLMRRAIDIVKRIVAPPPGRLTGVAWAGAMKLFAPLCGCHGLVTGRVPWPIRRTTLPTVAAHGATRLPSVDVDSYNVELKDDEGFIGDRASKGAFRAIMDNWRKPLRKAGKRSLRRRGHRGHQQEKARRAARRG